MQATNPPTINNSSNPVRIIENGITDLDSELGSVRFAGRVLDDPLLARE